LKLKEISSKLKYHVISQSPSTKKSAKKHNITAEIQEDNEEIIKVFF
jgi:hypothetical protein